MWHVALVPLGQKRSAMAGEDDNAGSGSPVVKKQKEQIDICQLFEE